jgi:hypothetical protein
MVSEVTLCTSVREMLGSNLSQDTGYPYCGFWWFYSVPLCRDRDSTSIRPQQLPPKSFPIRHYTASVCRLNCCWPSPAQSFLAPRLVKIYYRDFCSLLDVYVFRSGALSSTGEGGLFGATFVAGVVRKNHDSQRLRLRGFSLAHWRHRTVSL